jgi:trimethylamine--corrinoid protein Co-methyltransferase
VKRNLQAGAVRNASLTLEVLSPTDVEDVHLSTLEVLERTGVFVEDDEALDLFADGGCRVDRERRVVKIPPHIVEDAVRSAPAKVYQCGRDPRNDFVLEAGRVAFCNFDEGIKVVDPFDGTHRDPTLEDIRQIARLVDALDGMAAFESAVGAHDVPDETAPIHQAEAALHNTTKCVGTEAVSAFHVRKIAEMAALIVGGMDELRERPIVGFGVCPVSPLQLPRDATEVIIATARLGLADTILSMAMSGASAPVTLAGTLVTHNAEVLSGVVLAQLTERGAPIVYGSSTTAIDLRLATAAVGSPELALISAACAQLARQYRLPSYIAGA